MTNEQLAKEELINEINQLRDHIRELEAKEYEFRIREHVYLEIINSSCEVAFIHDLEKGEIYYSTELKKKLGIEHLSSQEAFQAISACVHPEDAAYLQSAYMKAIEAKAPKVKLDFRAKVEGSGYIYVTGQANIIYNEEGIPIKYYGTHMDITECKPVEDEQNINQQRMEALLRLNQMTGNSINDLIKLAYQEAIKLTCSDIGFLGFVNKDSTDVDVYYWPDKVMEQCKVLRENLTFPLAGAGIWAEAVRQKCTIIVNDYSEAHPLKKGLPDGHLELKNLLVVPLVDKNRCVAVVAVANKDGDYNDLDVLQLNLLIEAMHKIIMRRESEEHLIQSEERFKTFFDNCPAAMIVLWVDSGKIIDLNPASERLFKWSKSEVVGKTYRELGILATPLSTVKDFRNIIRDVGSSCHELDVELADGSHIRVMLLVTQLKGNAQGQILASILDITELKRMEFEIARLDRLNLIGEMAASIGHEIRNPLTAIRGFLQMLGSKDEYADDQNYFKIMIEEIDRANGIISEYLGMAKDKRVDLQPESLEEIVFALFPIIQSDTNYREMNVLLELGQTSVAKIDINEIRQLIMNMVRNAIEAMKPGGTLTIGTFLENSDIVLFIKDEGHGLPNEIQKKIGTPFNTTKDRGTGLGLAVCYSIAARHNARIEYTTGPTGTTFYIRFPISLEHNLLF